MHTRATTKVIGRITKEAFNNPVFDSLKEAPEIPAKVLSSFLLNAGIHHVNRFDVIRPNGIATMNDVINFKKSKNASIEEWSICSLTIKGNPG